MIDSCNKSWPMRPMTSPLRPFFSFFGSKWRLAPRYPSPRYPTIVEPFAGGAGYSLNYPEREVVLCDVDPVIAAIWRYLIRVTPKEILAIPDLMLDQTVDDLKIPQEARMLVGFWTTRGASSPRKNPSSWMKSGISPKKFWGGWAKRVISTQVSKIQHWRIYNCSYQDCPVSTDATWFVDPPYQIKGYQYRFNSKQIDYAALGQWCASLPGQVIACETEGATWLPFQRFAEVCTVHGGRRSQEMVWHSLDGEVKDHRLTSEVKQLELEI